MRNLQRTVPLIQQLCCQTLLWTAASERHLQPQLLVTSSSDKELLCQCFISRFSLIRLLRECLITSVFRDSANNYEPSYNHHLRNCGVEGSRHALICGCFFPPSLSLPSLSLSQEYQGSSVLGQFVTRFMLRETSSQLLSLQRSLQCAMEAVEEQSSPAPSVLHPEPSDFTSFKFMLEIQACMSSCSGPQNCIQNC